jgi:two-component system OmpR family sensor kinase
VSNLIGNAVIHTPAGTPIELDVERRGGDACMSVRDHGRGLPDGAGEQLFERFWRGEAGRQRGPGGAGLGLAIVRAIAGAHGGEAHAADAPGGGALFTVVLPVSASSASSQQTLSVLNDDSYLHRSH